MHEAVRCHLPYTLERFSDGWDVAFSMAYSRATKVYMETCNFPLTSVTIWTSKRVGKRWISPEKVDEI